MIELKLPNSPVFLVAMKDQSLSPKETQNLFEDLSAYFPQQQDFTLKYKWENPLLALLGAFLVASAGYAAFHLTVHAAPTGLLGIAQAPSGQLLAFNNSTALFFDNQGNLTDINHTPHLDYRAAAFDGNDRYYIMDRKSEKLLICRENKCSPSLILAVPPLSATLGLTVSADHQYLITVEPSEDRVRVFTLDGQQRQVLSRPDHQFCFPNNGVFGRDGRFYMTDTNLNRIVAFDFINGLLRETEEYSMVKSRHATAGEECMSGKINRFIKRAFPKEKARELPGVRKGRVWPMDITQLDDGRWAVLIARSGMRDADIVLFDEDWTKPEPLTMPSRSDITAITSWEDRLFATDLGDPGLWVISNKQFSPWKNDSFQEWLRALKKQKLEYRKQRALVLLCLFSVVTLLAFSVLLINQIKFKKLSQYSKKTAHETSD
jgi:hypothetical protein